MGNNASVRGIGLPCNLCLPKPFAPSWPPTNARHVLVSPPVPPLIHTLIFSSSSPNSQYPRPHQQYYPPSAINSPVPHHPTAPRVGSAQASQVHRSKTGCLTCRVKKIKVSRPRHPCAHHYPPSATRPSPTVCAARTAPATQNFPLVPPAHSLHAPTVFMARESPCPQKERLAPRRRRRSARPPPPRVYQTHRTPPGRELTPPRRNPRYKPTPHALLGS